MTLLRRLLLPYMKYYRGDRCREYDSRCYICQAWKAFDYLFPIYDD